MTRKFEIGDQVKVGPEYLRRGQENNWPEDLMVTEGIHTVVNVSSMYVTCAATNGTRLMFLPDEIMHMHSEEDRPVTIVAAAIKCLDAEWGDFIISAPPPARHGNLLFGYYNLKGEAHKNAKLQGFLTSTGEFVDREEAMRIVLAAGQPLIDHPSRVDGILFSEDLW